MTIPAGWPCATLPATPPSVADRQAAPTADDLLPQVLALAPRGPAWGTDEAGDGRGASPVMRRVWRAVAAWVGANNAREFDLATQALPTAITWSLADWEAEYGLPDPCNPGSGGAPARVAAVRARFAAVGGQSPAYFVCLAASIGQTVTVEEFHPLRCGRPVGTRHRLMDPRNRHTWRVTVVDQPPIRFRVGVPASGEGGTTVGRDPLLRIRRARDLECLLQRLKPAHTRLLIRYVGATS